MDFDGADVDARRAAAAVDDAGVGFAALVVDAGDVDWRREGSRHVEGDGGERGVAGVDERAAGEGRVGERGAAVVGQRTKERIDAEEIADATAAGGQRRTCGIANEGVGDAGGRAGGIDRFGAEVGCAGRGVVGDDAAEEGACGVGEQAAAFGRVADGVVVDDGDVNGIHGLSPEAAALGRRAFGAVAADGGLADAEDARSEDAAAASALADGGIAADGRAVNVNGLGVDAATPGRRAGDGVVADGRVDEDHRVGAETAAAEKLPMPGMSKVA